MISLYIVPSLTRDLIMIFLTLTVHFRPVVMADEDFTLYLNIFVLSFITLAPVHSFN